MFRKYSLFFLLGLITSLMPISAHAQRDAVQFASPLRIQQGSSMHDAVCFFCGLHADGDVNGDAVVFFGSVDLKATAHRDLIVLFGNVKLEDGATVNGDLVNFFGTVRLGENTRVGKDLIVFLGTKHASSSAVIGKENVVIPLWIALIPSTVFLLIVFGILMAIRGWQTRRAVVGYPLPPMQ